MPIGPTDASYDEVPYDGGLAEGTHPDRLAVIAGLFGIAAPPVETASVLEIGCGVGSNLLPMAYSLPNASFLGIDPSERQIDMARDRAERLGLSNVRLEVADIRDYESLGGPFDYIICHGVFSWVPEDVRAAILQACRELSTPNGLSVISYNVLPGFYSRLPVRDLLRFHAQRFPNTEDRIAQARSMIEFFGQAVSAVHHATSPYAGAMKGEVESLGPHSDAYVMHEHLADTNVAFYYHDFVAQASAAGLQCIGDTTFSTMLLENYPPELKATLHEISPDQVTLEQFNDFLTNRMFRRTILSRAGVPVDRAVPPERIQQCLFRGVVQPEPDGSWRIDKTPGLTAPVKGEAVLAVLQSLYGSVPPVLTFDQLLASIPEEAWPPEVADGDARRRHLSGILLSLFAHDAVELRVTAPRVASEIRERPVAYLPARLAASSGIDWLQGPYHNSVYFEEFVKALVPLLDGTRDLSELARDMSERYAEELSETTTPVSVLVAQALDILMYSGFIVSEPGAPSPAASPA